MRDLEELESQNDQRDDENQVNQATADMKAEPEKPKYEENQCDCPKHEGLPPQTNECSNSCGVFAHGLTATPASANIRHPMVVKSSHETTKAGTDPKISTCLFAQVRRLVWPVHLLVGHMGCGSNGRLGLGPRHPLGRAQ